MSTSTTFLSSTVGLNGFIDGQGQPKMLLVHKYRINDGSGDIQLRLASGHNLAEYPGKAVVVASDKVDAQDHRPGTVEEARWAFGLLGVEV